MAPGQRLGRRRTFGIGACKLQHPVEDALVYVQVVGKAFGHFGFSRAAIRVPLQILPHQETGLPVGFKLKGFDFLLDVGEDGLDARPELGVGEGGCFS